MLLSQAEIAVGIVPEPDSWMAAQHFTDRPSYAYVDHLEVLKVVILGTPAGNTGSSSAQHAL